MLKNFPNLKDAGFRSKGDINRYNFVLKDAYKDLGFNKKYLIKTHGCLANERDSENIAGILESAGFCKTDDESVADLIIINTCAIRSGAENKVYGEIGALKRYKDINHSLIIGICGCMAQEEDTINEIISTYHQIDIVFGTHNINQLLEYIDRVYNKEEKVIDVKSFKGEVIENLPDVRKSKYKALVNIMYGCNKFCSYCIVPYTRGQERSRMPEDILKEVKELKEKGYIEINLLGQNVNAYGKDLDINYDFSDLLKDVAELRVERIRFMTSHPWDFNDKMIDVIKQYDNIMPYIHLPLQSGSDNVLKKMNRSYNSKQYKTLFDKLRDNLPNFTFSTDIIVAFPGESEEDFNDTLDIVNYCKFDSAFTFIFSKRKGTPAYDMDDPLSDEEKNRRLSTLNEKVALWANYNNMKYKNRILEVLVDGPSKKNKNILSGYSRENKLVNFTGDAKEGDIVNVLIEEPMSFSLNGKMVNKVR